MTSELCALSLHDALPICAFASEAEAIMAFDAGELHLNAPVTIRFSDIVPPRGWEAPEGWTEGDPITLSTTLGTVYFNETLPEDFPYVEGQVGKKRLEIGRAHV